MPPFWIIKHLNIFKDIRPGFSSWCIYFILSRFNNWKKLSATALSWQFPLRLILHSRLCCLRKVCHSWPVYWQPWSEWIRTLFCGFLRHRYINNASKTRSVVILDFIDQPTTRREKRSITTARYSTLHEYGYLAKQCFSYQSPTINWLGWVGLNCQSKVFAATTASVPAWALGLR